MNIFSREPARLANACDTLRRYAALRGHVVVTAEIERALLQSLGESPEAVIDEAWRVLFPHEALNSVPAKLAEPQHFPALVWSDDTLAIVDEIASIGVFTGKNIRVPCTVVPKPTVIEVNTDDKPATAAIKAVLKAHMPIFARVGIATVLVNLLAIVTSVFAMQVYDRVVPNFSYPTLWALASGVILAIVFDLLFKSIRLSLMESLTRRVDEALSQFFFEKIMALKLDRRPPRTGVLVAQVRDYESVKAFFTSTTLFALADMPFIFFFIAVIALLGGIVALVPLCLLPICIAIGLIVQRPLAKLQQQQTDESARRQGLLIEMVHGAESVKAQGGEWRFGTLWLGLTRELADYGYHIRRLSGGAQHLSGSFQQLAYVLVMVVGVFQIEAGHLTTGGLIACSILASRAMGNSTQLTGILVQWHHAKHALHVLDKLLVMPSDDSDSRQASNTLEPHYLSLNGVQYAYEVNQGTTLTINNLHINAGERVAVLGRNGSGKSTLLKLMAGLGTPNAGEVKVAGLDLQQCRLGWLRETVGYLPQDVRLFGGTLRENLTMGLGQPTDEHLHEALMLTGLNRFVAQLSLGLDTPIREGGVGLSGGQRQLIGVTRLVLLKPRIWLLDEPSASLDRESEQSVMAFIKALPPDVTVIFTTHRMNWLPLSQRTLLLDEGTLKADVPTERVRNQPSTPQNSSVIGAPIPRADAAGGVHEHQS